MPNVHETAVELHRELSRRGLELNPKVGRDAALFKDLAGRLDLPTAGFTAALAKSGLSAEEYLIAFASVAQPFAQMFCLIWSYLAQHCAQKAGETLLIRFGLKGHKPVEIDWDEFRVMVESTEKIWARGTVAIWPLEPLFRLGQILIHHTGFARVSTSRYQIGDTYTLQQVGNGHPHDKMAEKVRAAIQSWIEAVHAAWPLKREKDRDLPELSQYNVADASDPGDQQNLHDLAHHLTDLVPIWTTILANWERIPTAAKEEATVFFETHLGPAIRRTVGEGWRSVLTVLDILDLPFWKHRWHTYEIWATITALEALEDYSPRPIVEDGHVALDSTVAAVVATLAGQQTIYAHVQGQTRLSSPFGKRQAIKPDLRFSLDNPATNSQTIAIVEFKQRKDLDAVHASEILHAYSRGTTSFGGVVLINYDATPSIMLPPRCVMVSDVHPGNPMKVREYQAALKECFIQASALPPLGRVCVLLDVSGSMSDAYSDLDARRGLKRLAALSNAEIYRFNDGLVPGGDLPSTSQIVTGGGTQLGTALEQVYSLKGCEVIERLLIVTDGDHEHPQALLDRVGAYEECLPTDLEKHLAWLMGH